MREVCSESFTAIKGSTQDLPQWFGMYPQDSVRGESPGLSFISCRYILPQPVHRQHYPKSRLPAHHPFIPFRRLPQAGLFGRLLCE